MAPTADKIRAAPFTKCPMYAQPRALRTFKGSLCPFPREAGPALSCAWGLPTTPTVQARAGVQCKVWRGPSARVWGTEAAKKGPSFSEPAKESSLLQHLTPLNRLSPITGPSH